MQLYHAPAVPAAAHCRRQLQFICVNHPSPAQAGLIIAGFDARSGGGEVYAIPLGGTLLRVPFAIGGSGSAYITGWCDKHWKPDMGREEAREFVRAALRHAMARDSSSGGCVRTVVIDANGADREFIPNPKLPATYGELQAPAAAAAARA